MNSVEAPIAISFGMAELEDIDAAVVALNPHRPGIGIFHCVSIYPPRPDELRLANIPFLRQRFPVPIGFSDHSDDVITSLIGLSLGACMFEKHVTLDRCSSGPDHPFALDPAQMKAYVTGVKTLAGELSKGGFVAPTNKEFDIRTAYLKSVVAPETCHRDGRLGVEDITLARPGTGIPPKDFDVIVGRTVRKAVARIRFFPG